MTTDQDLTKEQPETRPTEQERIGQVIDSIRQFSQAGDSAHVVAALETLHPADQAAALIELSDEIRPSVIELLGMDATARIVEEMRPEDAARICEALDVGAVANMLDQLGPDHGSQTSPCPSWSRSD